MLPVGLPHGRDQVLVQFVKPKKKIMFKAVIMTNIMVMMIDEAYQHIPTRHIPTRWEYDMMIRGGNVTLSYSHHIYYIYHYTYVWVICLSS